LITSASNDTTNNTNSVAVSFTAAAYSVVVLLSGTEQPTSSPPIPPTSVSGLGLTWVSKYNVTAPAADAGTGIQSLAVWYAINNSASTATGTVTANYPVNFDNAAVLVCSFSGCNLSNPWSTAAPASGVPGDSFSVANIPVSTIPEAGTTAIVCYASNEDYQLGTVNGYTEIRSLFNDGLTTSYYEQLTAAYQKFTAPQSATTVYSTIPGSYPVGLSVVLLGV
jgi:hypothetical protein